MKNLKERKIEKRRNKKEKKRPIIFTAMGSDFDEDDPYDYD